MSAMNEKSTLNLIVIGPKHSGKTVYLATLANNPEVALNDPATIEVVSMHWKTLKSGSKPDATAGAISRFDFSYHCTIDSQEYNLDFTVPDYDGQIAETLSKTGDDIPERAQLRQIIRNADGFIVFMPYGDEDQKTMEAMEHEMGSFIGIVRDEFGEHAKIPAPLIVAVNKWDKSPDFRKNSEDAAAQKYIESVPIYKQLYERLCNYFANVTVMAISAYGHKTNTPEPMPGKLAPYRVTEPVKLVLKHFFANFKAKINREADNPPELAKLLLISSPLWKRLSGEDFDDLLKQTLAKCFNDYTAKLKTAATYRQFQLIRAESAEASLTENFSPEQQVEIERIGGPLLARQKRERVKWFSIAATVIVLLACTWYLVQLHLDVKRDWQEAIGAETQKQPRMMAEFIAKYSTGTVSRLIASEAIKQARGKLQLAVANLQSVIDERLNLFEKVEDSCKIATEAKQLLALSENMSQSLSASSMTRLESAYELSSEICNAHAAIEASNDEESLIRAMQLLSDKPETAEVMRLRELAAAKNREFSLQNDVAIENERIVTIAEAFRDLKDEKLNDVKDFIREHERDTNPDVQRMVEQANDMLPEKFYAIILEMARGINSLNSYEFAALRKVVSENIQNIRLESGQINSIRQTLQNMFDEVIRKKIEALPSRITTESELKSARTSIKEIGEDSRISFDQSLFEYRFPLALEQTLKSKINRLSDYERALEYGVNADWKITAKSNNAIDLDCDNMIMRDARLSISFYGGNMPDQSSPEDRLRCTRLEGNRGYVFYFDGKVNKFDGKIRLTKNRLWPRDPLSCSAGLVITESDIISLINGLSVSKELNNNCPGIAITFTSGSR